MSISKNLRNLHFHAFGANELERQKRTDGKTLFHRRGHLFVYELSNERKRFQADLTGIIRKPIPAFGAMLHIGNRGSETPFDGHLQLFGSAIYWGLGSGHRLANWITSRGGKKWGSRDIGFHNGENSGQIYWSFWEQEDGMRGNKPGWQRGVFDLDIRNRIWGEAKYSYTTLDTAEFEIDMLEDSYPVKVEYQLEILKRPKSNRILKKGYSLSIDAPKGIPYEYDKSGGWKGDRCYGFGVNAPPKRDDWELDAKMAIEAWVLEHRARTGFRKVQED